MPAWNGRPAPGLLWGLIAAGVCASMIPLEPNLTEEGYVLHVAQRIVGGEGLYRDIIVFTGPLPFELLAVLFRLFGEEIVVGRIVIVILQGLATGSIYTLAHRAGAGSLAHAAAACIAGAPVFGFPLFSIYFYSIMAFQLTLIAAWAALRGVRSRGWAIAAGVIVACVALSKQTVGLALAVALPLAMLVDRSEERPHVLAMLMGGVGVAVLTLGFYGVRADLQPLFDGMVFMPLSLRSTFSAPYVNLWPPGAFDPAVVRNQTLYLPSVYTLVQGLFTAPGRLVILLTQLMYGLPLLALVITALRRLTGPLPRAAWLHTAAFAALIAHLFPRTDWGHLVYVLPVAVTQLVIAGQPIVASSLWSRANRWTAVGAVLLLGAGTAVTGGAHYMLSETSELGPRVPQRPVGRMTRSRALARVVELLRERTEPGDSIFVARAEPLLYFATETRNPTPYSGVIPAMREEQQRRILEALGDVRYVVMSDIDQPGFTYYRDELPAVQAYLERHFHVLDNFRTVWLTLLERGPDRGATLIDLIDELPEARAFTRGSIIAERPETDPPPQLPTRLNHRPLAFWLGSRGGGVDFEIDVPEDAVFQAGVGFGGYLADKMYAHPRRTHMAVSVRDGAGFKRLGSEPVLFGRDRGFFGRGQGHAWRPIEVDLGAYAGRHVTLRLELLTERVLEPGLLSWWGSPRIATLPD